MRAIIYAIAVVVIAVAVAAFALHSYKPLAGGKIDSLSISGHEGIGSLMQYLLSTGPSQTNVSYTGAITISAPNSSYATSSSSKTFPVLINYESIGNASRIGIAFLVNETIGEKFAVVFINRPGNGTYSCAFSISPYGNQSACNRLSYQYNSSGTLLSNAHRLLSLSSTSVNFVRQTSHNGLPCTFVNGTESLRLNSTALSDLSSGSSNISTAALADSLLSGMQINGGFNSCISDQYRVPLNLSAQTNIHLPSFAANQTYTIDTLLLLNETSIGRPVSLSQIETLPAPLTPGS